MFQKNDYFIYSFHGVCQIDDICERSINGEKRMYYVFHPVMDEEARIMIPVDNKKVFMRPLVAAKEAKEIIRAFCEEETIPWIEDKKLREKVFTEMIRSGKLSEIAKVVKVLLKRQQEAKESDKRFSESDKRMLQSVCKSLCIELAIVNHTTFDEINEALSEAVSVDCSHALPVAEI